MNKILFYLPRKRSARPLRFIAIFSTHWDIADSKYCFILFSVGSAIDVRAPPGTLQDIS
jgi:hypothetical protein